MNSIKKSVTSKTKVIAFAGITNVVGDVRPVKEITEFAHKNKIYVLLDAAQYIPHKK